MVINVKYGSAFNPLTTYVPGVYVEVIPPTGYYNGVATSIGWVNGGASWGQVNSPILIGTPQGQNQVYGGISAASLTDPFDLATDVVQALSQAQNQAGLAVYAQRQTDGTDTKASVSLFDAAPTAAETISGLWTGILGNQIAMITAAGSMPSTVSVTVVPFPGGGNIELFANLSSAMSNTVTMAGTGYTAADVMTLTFGGGVTATINYTLLSSPAPTAAIAAAGLAAAINLNSTLQTAGVTATVAGAVITLNYPASLSAMTTVFSKTGTGSETGTVGTPNSAFWTNLKNALANGLSSTRGPSLFVRGSNVVAALPPALGTFSLAGGTDGRTSLTSSMLVGSATGASSGGPSGIYTASSVAFPPSVLWCAGLTDSTQWATIDSFCDGANIFSLMSFPANTSTSTACTTKATLGIADYQMGIMKDCVYIFDQVNNQVRLITPTATAAGTMLTLPPWVSPLNVQVSNIIGTERNNPYTGNQPYGFSELNQLGQAGIMVLTNPVPGGQYFGFALGVNSVGNNAVTAPVEYSRLTNFLVQSQQGLVGPYIGGLQSISPSDPLRAKVTQALNNFYGLMETSGEIAGFNAVCNTTNNTNLTVPAHLLVTSVQATYLSTVNQVLSQIQGGTTVQTSANQIGTTLGGPA